MRRPAQRQIERILFSCALYTIEGVPMGYDTDYPSQYKFTPDRDVNRFLHNG